MQSEILFCLQFSYLLKLCVLFTVMCGIEFVKFDVFTFVVWPIQWHISKIQFNSQPPKLCNERFNKMFNYLTLLYKAMTQTQLLNENITRTFNETCLQLMVGLCQRSDYPAKTFTLDITTTNCLSLLEIGSGELEKTHL